jgi:tetratricopeptide (TPR) repeat protein
VGKSQEGLKALQHAEKLANDPLAHFEMGITELETFRNPAAALPHFQRVIELTPTAHRAWTFAGICQVRVGKSQEGLKALQHAEKLGAKSAVHLEALGDAFFHLENFPQARDLYQVAQQQGGQSALLESKLGVCELRLGNREGLRRVQNAVAREPHFAELYDILTAAALLVGDAALAAEAAARRPGAT